MSSVSIIIPTYNRSKLVREAIESVLKQTYSDFEIIVVDDGSTDDTASVIKQINDNRIIYCYQDNGGQSSARNLGLIRAKGTYIAYLDEDDLWLPEYIETVINQLENYKEYGATYTRVMEVSPDGKRTELSTSDRYISGWITKHYFDSSPCLMPSGTCFRKSVWENFFWDEAIKRSPDYDVFLRISVKTQFLFVPDIYVIKRSMPDSLSTEVNPIGPIDGALTLERFYFTLGGNKYVTLKAAKRKISHRYRKAAKIACSLGNIKPAILLFKKAVKYQPLDMRLYFDMLKVLLKNKKNEKFANWEIPKPFPPYITVSQENKNV